MPQITALIIDSREPDWVKSLKFEGLPVLVDMLPTGDIRALTDDGHELLIERKTPDDFLNTLKDERLFPQIARMTEQRNAQIAAGEAPTVWPYLVITEPLTSSRDGKAITQRGITGWSFAAVMGAILSIQELGVHVVYCNGDLDYQDCVLRLGRRNHNSVMRIMPAKIPNVLGPKATFLAGLPGVGIEAVQDILDWCDGNIAHALSGLTDLTIKAPVGIQKRKTIKTLLGLEDNQSLELVEKEI